MMLCYLNMGLESWHAGQIVVTPEVMKLVGESCAVQALGGGCAHVTSLTTPYTLPEVRHRATPRR